MFRLLVLGAVQGLTEFLPVSSSGHLVLVPFLLGWQIPGVGFDVAVHLGTALAVVVYFRSDLAAMVAGTTRVLGGREGDGDRQHARLAALVVVGTVPAAIVGLGLRGFFHDLFLRPEVVALLLLGTAALLVVGEWLHRHRGDGRPVRDLRILDALVVGTMQAIAIAPGISRSGATIVGGLARGLSREAAARFAFLLGLPAFVGAGVAEIPDLPEHTDVVQLVGAAAVSAVVGLLAIAALLRWVRSRSLRPFAVYCVLFSAIGLGYWAQVR